MQKKHAKGLFIDTSCRRAGLLRTLLQGFRSEPHDEECGGNPDWRKTGSSLSSDVQRSHMENDDPIVRKVVSL